MLNVNVKVGPTILSDVHATGKGLTVAVEFVSLVNTGPYYVFRYANAPAKLTTRVAKKLARGVIDHFTVLAEWTERTERNMYRVV